MFAYIDKSGKVVAMTKDKQDMTQGGFIGLEEIECPDKSISDIQDELLRDRIYYKNGQFQIGA